MEGTKFLIKNFRQGNANSKTLVYAIKEVSSDWAPKPFPLPLPMYVKEEETTIRDFYTHKCC